MVNIQIFENPDVPVTIFYPSNSQAITVLVLAKTGSRYESENLSGVSHFIEHMLFKSTKKRPNSKVIAMDIEMMGGITNAFTSYEYTGYYIKSAAREVLNSIEILGDIISNSIFKQKDFEKERGVILEEIKMYQDKPTSRVAANWKAVFYNGHSLGRDIAGTTDIIKNLSHIDLRSYYSKNYFNDNLVISVAGEMDYSDKIYDQIRRCFINIKRPSSYPETEYKLITSTGYVIDEYKDLEQAHVYMGFEVSALDFYGEIVSELVNVILSEGFGSRLFQKLREEMGIVYYLYSDFTLFHDCGRMNLGFGTDLKKLERVIEEVIKELNLLIEKGILPIELDRAKKYFVSRFLFDTELSDELASWAGIEYIEKGRIMTIQDITNTIAQINLEDIYKFIKKEFLGKHLLISILSKSKRSFENKFNLCLK